VLREEVASVLVTGGGGDQISPSVGDLACAVQAALPAASVTAVRGPFSKASFPEGVSLLDRPPDLAEAMVASDVVVSSAGQTLLEALATGAPTVGVVVSPDQRTQ